MNPTARRIFFPQKYLRVKRWCFFPSDKIKNLVLNIFIQLILSTTLYAAGINIPSGSSLNVNSDTLTVTGDITNTGMLQTSSGTIKLTGNWNNSSGIYTANTGTVDLNGTTGTQTLTSGGVGVGKLFYNLTHSGAGTVQAIANAIDVDNNFVNSSGTFNANSLDMNVAGNWTNSGTFTSGTNTVTLDGTNQSMTGSSTFYNFSKTVTSIATLTFPSGSEQIVTHSLTLHGAAGQLLSLRSSSSPTQSKLTLNSGGTQAISYVDVKDNNAGNGLTLFAGSTSVDSGNNINWIFGGTTITWTGTTSTDWDTPSNWNLGFVPGPADTAVIPNVSNQPVLATNVTIANLTINTGATVSLNGKNLTITSTLSNDGTVQLFGSEAVIIGTVDSDSGTFVFTGDGDATPGNFTIPDFGTTTDYFNVVINDTHAVKDTFLTNANLNLAGTLHVTSGTLDISTNGNTLTTAGTLTVDGGTLTATNGNIDANGSVVISSGTLTAPGSGKSFTIAGNFTHSGGTFNNSSARVTLDTTTAATISGNTTFYNLTSSTGGKQINFTAGSNQTVQNTFDVSGTNGNLITLRSTTAGSKWDVTVSGGAQNVGYLDVKDSNADTNTITCLNCTDSGNNNANWIFMSLRINVPISGKTVGTLPTIIGVGSVGSTVTIKDSSNATVATTTVDANGNFRVQATTALSLGANSLTPSIGVISGPAVTLSVVASPTTMQVPTVTSPLNNAKVNGSALTLTGQGKPGQTVTVLANDLSGNMLLQTVGTGTVDSSGNYAVTLSKTLFKGANFLSVTVDQVASSIITVYSADPFGIVFDSETNEAVTGAVVTLYTSSGGLAQPGVDIASTDTNPLTTGADGFYSFLAVNGSYYIRVSAAGYNYPSAMSSFPPGRFVTVGSKGEPFSSGSSIVQIDQPLDLTRLLRIQKDANKSQAHVGDVVTYTVSIQNTSATTNLDNVILVDKIPPGFKYLKNRVILDGTPIADPGGQRPVNFTIGTMNAQKTKTLKYQLVIGSGVTTGNYENVAVAKNNVRTILSNRASATVKIALDPLFDMGTVIGKVFWDKNENGIQDPPEYHYTDRETITEGPVPNVQIVTEEGTVITTDKDGQFSLPGIVPGRHLFRLDERTLPQGSYLTTDKVVIVDLTNGSMAKVNFGVQLSDEELINHEPSFFVEKLNLTQDKSKPKPRLNVSLFNPAAIVAEMNYSVSKALAQTQNTLQTQTQNQPQTLFSSSLPSQTSPTQLNLDSASSGEDEIILYHGPLLTPLEFRIFTNYSPFIDKWKIQVMDQETKKLIRSFEGDQSNINLPVFWEGRDQDAQMIRPDRHYVYIVTVENKDGQKDETKEKRIMVKKEDDLKDNEPKNTDEKINKPTQQQIDILKSQRYHNWLQKEYAANTLAKQTITVDGETMIFDRISSDIRGVRILKSGAAQSAATKLYTELLVVSHQLSARDLLEGNTQNQKPQQFDIILPQGEYEIQVQEAQAGAGAATPDVTKSSAGVAAPAPAGVSSQVAPEELSSPPGISTQTYSKKVKVGEDYLFFVAMGDAQMGYTFDRKNIEGVAKEDKYRPGFWSEGKMAYFLKGKIKGKYLVTSSFDTSRQNQTLFKNLDPNQYYPIYGDASSKDYSATDTQGMLYLLVQWDKSSVLWGDYSVGFQDTEFAQYNRTLYGGKIDYQSVTSTQFGDPLTKVVVFRAQAKQKAAHNEFLGTGGSLFYLKNKGIVEGSEKISVETRDRITGLVLSKKDMKRNADYEISYSEGRMLFFKPVQYFVDGQSIISNLLLNGNPVYVVVDYEYAVQDKFNEGSVGTRVQQAVTDYVKVGATYVKESQEEGNYSLKGTDTTVYLGKDATVTGEYAQTKSQAGGTFISTDGGLSFTELTTAHDSEGRAYGLKGDARLFNRLGLNSYYKWIDHDFSTPATSSQQGKALTGFAATYDLTPHTRISAKQDIQNLIDNGNPQTQLQVGAKRTVTSSLQVIHEIRHLRLTTEYQHQEVTEKKDQFASQTNTQQDVLAAQADYQLTDKVNVSLQHQETIKGEPNHQTSLGLEDKVNDQLALRAKQTIGKGGTATGVGATLKASDKMSVSGDYTIVNNQKSGQVGGIASVGTDYKVNDQTSLQTSVGVTGTLTGEKITTATVGGTTQMDDQTKVRTTLGLTDSSVSGRGTIMGMDAEKQVDEKTELTSGVSVAEKPGEGKTSTITFGTKKQVSDELKLISSRSFGTSRGAVTQGSSYGLVREKDGRKLQGTLTRQHSDASSVVSDSNIFGLSGDLNDHFAVLGSYEKGLVQNHDGSQADRQALALGVGYVQKDAQTTQEILKASSKLELRQDSGAQNTVQYVVNNAVEGKINPDTSVYVKTQFSNTTNTTANSTRAGYKEMTIGGAHRPLYTDRLNLLARYTYSTGQKPSGQVDTADIEQQRAHVLSADAIYDLTDHWQVAERLAYRQQEEKVTGFDFTRTQTWLMIHRLNYNIDRDWQLSGEYRILTQVEAQDQKRGFMLEASRRMNDNAQLGVGYNFTTFTDDLTDLGFTAQGPFLRVTAKLYDRTPEEMARAKQRRLEESISSWAWAMVNEELARPQSPIVAELKNLFVVAQSMKELGKLEESQRIYKDIIVTGEMMFEEAADYIRSHIAEEEKLKGLYDQANEYFKKDQYDDAKKLWEKILEDAKRSMLK